MFSRPQGTGDGFMDDRRPPQIDQSPAAPTGIRRFNTYLTSERRRIVAQVRRELPKDRDFRASIDSMRWCDDLLATTVDNADWAGL